MLETGLQSLALEAVGVQGPIGRVAEGLLRFGGGSTLVLGAAAGIGLIAGAYKLAAAEAEQLQATNEKLAASWRAMVARGKPVVALANELQTAIDAQTVAQDKLNKMTGPIGPGHLLPSTEGEIALARTGLSQAQANVAEARRLFDAAQVQLEADFQKKGLKTAQAFIEGIKFLTPQMQLQMLALGERQFGERFRSLGGEAGALYATAWHQAADAVFDARRITPIGGGLTLPRNIEKGGPTFGPALQAPKFPGPDRDFITQGLEKAITKARPERPDPARLAAEAVALLGALKQGGAAEIVGATGGGLTALSSFKGLRGLAPFGIAATALGGFFSLFDHSEERRHRELVEAVNRMGKEVGIQSVRVLVVDGAGNVLHELNRAEEHDAVQRVPGFAGVTG